MGGQLNRNVSEIEEKRGCPTLEACQSKANEAERGTDFDPFLGRNCQ